MAKARDVGDGAAAVPAPHPVITRPLTRAITTFLTAGRPRERRFVTSTLLYYAGADALSPRFGTGCDPYLMMGTPSPAGRGSAEGCAGSRLRRARRVKGGS